MTPWTRPPHLDLTSKPNGGSSTNKEGTREDTHT
jgi:hypothetical protein